MMILRLSVWIWRINSIRENEWEEGEQQESQLCKKKRMRKNYQDSSYFLACFKECLICCALSTHNSCFSYLY